MNITLIFPGPQPNPEWPERIDIQMPNAPQVGERIEWLGDSASIYFGIEEVCHQISPAGVVGVVVYLGEARESRVE